MIQSGLQSFSHENVAMFMLTGCHFILLNECLNSTSGTFLMLVAFTENMCCNVILLPLDGAERQCVAWELNQSEPKRVR